MTRRYVQRRDDATRHYVAGARLGTIDRLSRYRQDRQAAIHSSRTWQLTCALRLAYLRVKPVIKAVRDALKSALGRTVPKAHPRISVVLPVPGPSDQLSDSIESILGQSCREFELLLVMSEPTARPQIERFEAHPYVKVLECGHAEWHEAALRVARGEYLAFQEVGQIAFRDRLAQGLAHLDAYQADMVYAPWVEPKGTRPTVPTARDLADPTAAVTVALGSVMLRVDALRAAGGLKPSLAPHQWAELWSRLAGLGMPIIPLDQPAFRGPVPETPAPTHDQLQELRIESRKVPCRKPRIAYLIPGKGISGGTAVVCQHLNRLRQRGFEVLLLDTLEDDKSLEWFPNQRVPVIPFSQRPRYLDVAVATGWQTVHYLDLLDSMRRFYFVQSDETRFTEDPALKAYIRETYQRPYEFFTEARWIQHWLRDEFGQSASYTPNGLDPDIIHPTDPIEPKGSRIRVLLEGPIDIPFKGMADAFAAVQDLDCEVWCVSSHGRPKPGWRCDRFFEAVPMVEMKRIYSSCDILLKMSRVEGFFGPPMEMMACGGTAVVSKVTGFDEYIEHGKNALVVEPGDVAGAREALHRLIHHPDVREQLVDGGRETARQWTWNRTIDTLERVFH